MNKLITTLIIVIFFSVASWAQTEAPKIIETIPAFGDCQVDPGLTEIVLKFDQAMMPGYSVVDTKNMPQYSGKLYWKDSLTLIIPVKLFPDKLYQLQFNNIRFQNFRNTEGRALNPEQLLFQTKSVNNAEINKKAYEQFAGIFPEQYSYAGFKGIDWVKELEQSRTDLDNSKSSSEFAIKLIQLLRKANDPHLWVDVEGQRYETGQMKLVHQNFGVNKMFSRIQGLVVGDKFSTFAGHLDSVAYLSITGWNNDFFKLEQKRWGNSKTPPVAVNELLQELFQYPNLIIDVRENSGGNEAFAKAFASCFMKDSLPFEKVVFYNKESGKFDAEHIKKTYPNKDGLLYKGNVYVLAGPKVMSSNESFVLMMKQLPNVKVVGMPTYGSTGNPQPYELANGVTVYLPSWQAYSMVGKLIEGNGIEPDVLIETKDGDFDESDVLVDAVLKMIK